MKRPIAVTIFVLVAAMLLALRLEPGLLGFAPRSWTAWLLPGPIAIALRPAALARQGRRAALVSAAARFVDLFVAGILFSAATNGLILPIQASR